MAQVGKLVHDEISHKQVVFETMALYIKDERRYVCESAFGLIQ